MDMFLTLCMVDVCNEWVSDCTIAGYGDSHNIVIIKDIMILGTFVDMVPYISNGLLCYEGMDYLGDCLVGVYCYKKSYNSHLM